MNAQSWLYYLLQKIAKGDDAAFRLFYHKTVSCVRGYCWSYVHNKELADDLTQETFLQVWRFAAHYDPEYGAVLSWVSAIARYRSLDCLKMPVMQAKRFKLFNPEMLEDTMKPMVEATEYVAQHQHLQRCFNQLPTAYQHTLHLAYFRGLSHQEIAMHLNAPLGSVKSQLRRGLQQLKQQMLTPTASKSSQLS